MSEQNDFSYAKALKNTLTENHIRKIADNILQLNKTLPDVSQSHIKEIRKNLARKRLSGGLSSDFAWGKFAVTADKLAELNALTANVARITRKNKELLG